jgi:F0F1-type ATP synthase assembly protein I
MTGLAGSGTIVLRASELCSSDPVELIVALLLGFSSGTVPSVLRGLADRETDLV